MQDHNPGELTDDKDQDDEEEDDGVTPLSEVGVAPDGSVDEDVEKCEEREGNQAQEYQPESCNSNFKSKLLLTWFHHLATF